MKLTRVRLCPLTDMLGKPECRGELLDVTLRLVGATAVLLDNALALSVPNDVLLESTLELAVELITGVERPWELSVMG